MAYPYNKKIALLSEGYLFIVGVFQAHTVCGPTDARKGTIFFRG